MRRGRRGSLGERRGPSARQVAFVGKFKVVRVRAVSREIGAERVYHVFVDQTRLFNAWNGDVCCRDGREELLSGSLEIGRGSPPSKSKSRSRRRRGPNISGCKGLWGFGSASSFARPPCPRRHERLQGRHRGSWPRGMRTGGGDFFANRACTRTTGGRLKKGGGPSAKCTLSRVLQLIQKPLSAIVMSWKGGMAPFQVSLLLCFGSFIL